MIRKKSFDTAMTYFDTFLWEHVSDCDMFAVTLPGDRIGYCIAMGALGSHISLALYIGKEGLASLYKMLAYDEDHPQGPDDDFNLRAETNLQCVLQFTDDAMTEEEYQGICRYMKQIDMEGQEGFPWPSLTSWAARRVPYPVNRQQEDDLVLALKAAIYVDAHLDEVLPVLRDTMPWGETIPLLTKEGKSWKVSETVVPTFTDIDYIIPDLPDHSLLDFFRRKPVKEDTEDLISMRILDVFITEELTKEDPAPYYPLMMARHSKDFFCPPIISHGVYQKDYNAMLEELAEQYADDEFRPEYIIVDSWHAFHFLKEFCEATNITLQYAYPLEEMEAMFDNMYEDMFNPVSMYQQFEEFAETHPEARKLLDQYLKQNNKGELDAEELYELFSQIMEDSTKD